jgi:hypothetical protein
MPVAQQGSGVGGLYGVGRLAGEGKRDVEEDVK